MRTIDDLRQMQALPLDLKVSLTKARIRQWVNEYGEDGVYVSFSGGKDSTVLLTIARQMYPTIPAMFVNTGLEFPELVQFVKTFDNVDIIRPKKNFKQVIQHYGYPFIAKEVAEVVYHAKNYLRKLAEKEYSEEEKVPYEYAFRKPCGIGEYSKDGDKQAVDLVALANSKDKWEMPYRISLLTGKYESFWGKKLRGEMEKDGKPSRAKYSQVKWQFLLNAPFDVSHRCCNVMKKEPAHRYAKQTGRHPMTAQMADESRLRTQQWLLHGCNGFDLKTPISNPMSFWTEQDVLQYIKENNIKIAPVYGEVIKTEVETDLPKGQLRINLDGTIEEPPCVYETTGCKRTGCVFCGFGCHLEKDGEHRFVKLKQTHPKLYEYLMKPESEGGLGYKEKIDWLNENGNLHIKY